MSNKLLMIESFFCDILFASDGCKYPIKTNKQKKNWAWYPSDAALKMKYACVVHGCINFIVQLIFKTQWELCLTCCILSGPMGNDWYPPNPSRLTWPQPSCCLGSSHCKQLTVSRRQMGLILVDTFSAWFSLQTYSCVPNTQDKIIRASHKHN